MITPEFSDYLTSAAMVGFMADRSRPDCGCKVEVSHHPATPENGAIRDCTRFVTDASECSIEEHKWPFGRPRS
jgi:hypothetical protein